MATSAIAVIGLDKALLKLNKDLARIPIKTKQGMIAAGLIVQAKAQKMAPVDTGNLKASGATIWGGPGKTKSPTFKGEGSDEMSSHHNKIIASEKAGMSKNPLVPEVEVVFTANYAIYVHEDMQAKHDGRGTAKFLELAVKSALPEIISAVKMEVRGK